MFCLTSNKCLPWKCHVETVKRCQENVFFVSPLFRGFQLFSTYRGLLYKNHHFSTFVQKHPRHSAKIHQLATVAVALRSLCGAIDARRVAMGGGASKVSGPKLSNLLTGQSKADRRGQHDFHPDLGFPPRESHRWYSNHSI